VAHLLEFSRLTPQPGSDADAQRHEFVATVELGEAADLAGPERAWLEVGGVATVYDVEVNGTVVLSDRSMWARHTVDVTALLRPGVNEVRVVVHPLTDLLDSLPSKPRARWRTMLTDEPRLRWVRTAILGRAPGFAPGPPVVGPYQPMLLHLDAPTRSLTPPPVREPGEWWPHTHGAGRGADRWLENRSVDSLELWVNDERIFVRGVVWTPGDLAALDAAVALGFNLIRVSGLWGYESEEFYDRCDDLGLMVWQDLPFVTYDYPLTDPDFRAAVEAEVADQMARLARHPSVVVICGNAEHEQQAAMFGIRPETGYAAELAALTRPIVEASGIEAVWVDGSPSGGDPVTRVDVGIAQYFGVGAYRRDLPDVRHARVGFAGECLAFAHLPDPVVGDPDDPGNRVGVPKDNGADWDFADVRDHYAQQRYGDQATLAERQRVSGEVSAEVFGEWRRPDSGCGGGIVLWLRDLEPGAGWGLLDHTGTPKPAARALAPVLQSTAVWISDEGVNGLDAHVAHDGPDPADLTLVVELLRADGSVIESGERAWTMAPRGHLVVGVDALLGRFADSAYAYRFGPPPHDAVRAQLFAAGSALTEARWARRA
jgi:beta-mannosidase